MARLRKDLRIDHFTLGKRVAYKFVRPYLSDVMYANCELKRWLGGGDVRNPVTFNEKIMWLKYNYRRPLLTNLADKDAVRSFVGDRIGRKYLNDVYGVFDNPHRIPIEELPNRFVIKATHGCDMNVLIEDKYAVNWPALLDKLDSWLRTDYSKIGREWIYEEIPRRLIVERFLSESGKPPTDYKVFCFNGEPYCIQVDLDRFGRHSKVFVDCDWKRLPFTIMHGSFDGELPRPSGLEEMLELSKILSSGLPFARVDWYLVPRIIFGEMTFFPLNGTGPFYPREWDFILGEKLTLPRAEGGPMKGGKRRAGKRTWSTNR